MKIKFNMRETLKWRNIRLNLLICTGIAVLLTTLIMIQSQDNILRIFFHTLIYSYSIGFSIYFSMTAFGVRSIPEFGNYFFLLLRLIISTAAGIFISRVIFSLIYSGSFLKLSFPSIIFLISTGILFGLGATMLFYFVHLSEVRKYKHLQEQEKKTQAELRALVSQINPHFLFNTLNSISSLIHIDPDRADEMLLKLSKVFRYSLQSGKKKFVSISEELKVVEHYLQIEKVRFSERLNYNFYIDDPCLNYAIPPLILQTLVENSVKHGISPKIEGGEVNISIKDVKDRIEIKIEDTGIGMSEQQKDGFGLDAVKNILQLQYSDHQFDLDNDNGVKIRISIPKVEINNEV